MHATHVGLVLSAGNDERYTVSSRREAGEEKVEVEHAERGRGQISFVSPRKKRRQRTVCSGRWKRRARAAVSNEVVT